jgi:hypothetical protein
MLCRVLWPAQRDCLSAFQVCYVGGCGLRYGVVRKAGGSLIAIPAIIHAVLFDAAGAQVVGCARLCSWCDDEVLLPWAGRVSRCA